METISLFINPILNVMPKLPEVLIDLVVGYLAIQFSMGLLNKFLKVTKLPQLRGIIISLTKFALWIVLLIFIANNLGFTKLAIALSSSVLIIVFFLNTGVAPLITDALSGVFLCTDPDFRTGSRVRLGIGEDTTEGIIKEVDMRKVRILDDNGKIHVVPNSVVEKNEWTVIEKKEDVVREFKEKAKTALRSKLKR